MNYSVLGNNLSRARIFESIFDFPWVWNTLGSFYPEVFLPWGVCILPIFKGFSQIARFHLFADFFHIHTYDASNLALLWYVSYQTTVYLNDKSINMLSVTLCLLYMLIVLHIVLLLLLFTYVLCTFPELDTSPTVSEYENNHWLCVRALYRNNQVSW